MKILITNDDSISSEVLLPLAKWAKQFGEVTVVVPKYEQSGKSHCIEIRKAFEVKQVPFDDPDIKAYTVDSSPADCVRFALEGMQTTFDFVISGINRGLNLGVDVLYSGTLGAVFEAATFGLPAVALSTKSGGFNEAMEALDEIKDFFVHHDLMNKNSLYNINIPLHTKLIGIWFRAVKREAEWNQRLLFPCLETVRGSPEHAAYRIVSKRLPWPSGPV